MVQGKYIRTKKHKQLMTKIKLICCLKGKKNPAWKGDKVKYDALHDWVRKYKLKPKICEDCKKNTLLEIANISGKYERNINDYVWICHKCHSIRDKAGSPKKITILTAREKLRIRANL